MRKRIVSTSRISEPHIEASISQYESDHFIFRIYHKVLSTCRQSMLHEDHRSALFISIIFAMRNTEYF